MLIRDDAHNQLLRNIASRVLMHGELTQILDDSMEILLSADWLKIKPQGGVFVLDGSGQHLNLVSKKFLSETIGTLCAKRAIGSCLCGVAAESRKTQFAHCVDERHTVTFDGMQPHGHYNVPILNDGDLIGVIVVYLEHGHKFEQSEVDFLETVADTLGHLISVKFKERALERSKRSLQDLLMKIHDDGNDE